MVIMEKKQIFGYHGTTQENAKIILNEHKYIDSKRDNDWLGTGVYFFAYLDHAKWWISARRYRDKETCILKSSLTYSDSQLLDLDDPSQLRLVEEIVKEAINLAKEAGETLADVDLENQELSKKWNFACNTFRRLYPEFGITIYTFQAKPYFRTIGYQETQRQICVSDHSIIEKTEIV